MVTPAPVVRLFPGDRLSCSAIGIPPIYIAIIRNSTTLANTTKTASIRVSVSDEGKYTCRGTSNHGTDERVVINGENIQIISFKVFLKVAGERIRH